MKSILLLGRTDFDLDHWENVLADHDVALFTGTTVEHVREILGRETVDVVLMGAGLPLETRLEIVGHVFEVSDRTTVHMKDRASGKDGMEAFVDGVLRGLTE